MSVGQVLFDVVHGNMNFCCLCSQGVQENAVRIDYEIYIDSQDTQTMYKLLEVIFGEDVQALNSASAFGTFCDNCKVSLINHYKFRKRCKENLQNLNSLLSSVTETFENVLPEVENFNTLFVIVDLHDFTTKQFYDDVNLESSSKAYKRFCSVTSTSKTNVDQLESLKVRNLIKCEIKNEKREWKLSSKMENIKNYVKSKKEPKVFEVLSVPTSNIVTEDSDTSNFRCKVCFHKYTEENKLRCHFFKMHYPRNVKCPKCPRKFITTEMLKQHEYEYHNAQVCSECGKIFTNNYVLRKHEMNHNLQIACDECGRVYRSAEAFKKHITDNVCKQKSKKSADQANFQCDHCNKRYCYKPYLAKHIMYEHGNAVGFRCKFCNKQFYTQSRLNTHLLRHTREKNFVCAICGGRFVTRESLIYHTRLHTGEKPYQCEHCDKAFLSASRRLDHTRRHHLPPSLECDICHTKFKATGSLLKHRKRHFNPNSKLSSMMRHSYATTSASNVAIQEKDI